MLNIKNIITTLRMNKNFISLNAINSMSFLIGSHQLFNFSSKQNKKIQGSNYPNLSQKKEKFRDKFINDYIYYKMVPFSVRMEQLQRIMNKTPSQQMFEGSFSPFPIQQDFIHNGQKLKAYRWQPQNKKPRGIVVLYHSLNGHTNMYGNLARALVKRGFIVTGIDLPNFGKSQGEQRGHINSFKSIAQPCKQFLHSIRRQHPNAKIFVGGNSLGGSIAFYLSTQYNNFITGTILLSPALRQNMMHHPMLKKLILIASLILPKFRYWKSSSRNGTRKKLTKYIQTDPYIYKGEMWTSTTNTMLISMNLISKQFKQLKTPYLMVQSGQDKLIDPFVAIDLQKQSPSPSKTTVIIKDMWHNVLFDDHSEDVIKIVEQWLEEQNGI